MTGDGDRPSRVVIGYDPGSSSHVAYGCFSDGLKGALLDLQAWAKVLLSAPGARDAANEDFEPLRDEDGKPSRRLAARFALENERWNPPLPEEHARLGFFDAGADGKPVKSEDAERTLLRLFFRKGAAAESFGRLIPSLKSLVQAGALLPRVIGIRVPGAPPAFVRFEPTELLRHLLAQVLLNLILGSPQMRAHGLKAEEVEVAVALPNIFAPHVLAETAEFLSAVTGSAVRAVYEGDALAHLPLLSPNFYPPEVKTAATTEFLGFRERFLADSRKEILVYDMGRSTTDLSLARFEAGGEAYSLRVLGRVGRGDGGNKAGYLWTKYFDGRLQAVLRRLGPGLEEKAGFLTRTEGWEAQAAALQHLEVLIEAVKAAVAEDWSILEEAEALRAAVEKNVPPLVGLLAARVRQLQPEADLPSVREALTWVLTLPAELERPAAVGSFPALPAWLRMTASKTDVDPAVERLSRGLAEYVEANTAGVLDAIFDAAEGGGGRGGAAAKPELFVIIAGQATQFAPLRSALLRLLHDRYGIPRGNVCVLPGRLMKDGVALGAAAALQAEVRLVNPEHIFGELGFLALAPAVSGGAYSPVDMDALNAGEEVEVHVDGGGGIRDPQGRYALIYSARRTRGKAPAFDDGYVTPLMTVVHPGFKIRTIPGGRVRVTDSHGEATESGAPAYGQAREAPWAKVWPERLPGPGEEEF